ncbi:MAG: guanylate kinase [Phycisphaerae bacterium]|nr:guanylate kinase [Phycisphaerae bacterium]
MGKSTIVREVLRRTGAAYSVSVTTRAPRADEVDGRDYCFVDRPTFQQKVRDGELLEWAEVFGQYYGTPAEPVRQAVASGRTVLLDIDVQGAVQVHRQMPGATFVLIAPPTDEALRRRLVGRGSEDPAQAQRRLAAARTELEQAERSGFYTHRVVNDDLETAIEAVVAVVREESAGR